MTPPTGPVTTMRQRLQQLVNWEARSRRTMRPGLAPVRDLLARLGDPQQRLRCVHVTGTKGKGSVCALIEAGLLAAGWRTGRYASPHVEHLNERICLAGVPVDDARLESALTQVLDARDAACADAGAARDATWFDVMTAAAFVCFADAGLDWAVVEVGLGGLLDSTNVVLPELAIVTNVELEHTDVLGPTLQDIARHKAGIAKPGRPLLSGVAPDHPARAVIAERAADAGAPLVEIDLRATTGIAARNLALARRALVLLGAAGHRHALTGQPLAGSDLSDRRAAALHLPGRMQRLQLRHPHTGVPATVLVDAAHVGFAVSAVLDDAGRDAATRSAPVVLLALAADKNAADIVARLAGRVRLVLCTGLPGGRPAWRADQLAALCAAQGLPALAEADPGRALDDAFARLGAREWLLVTGSFSLAGDALGRLRALARRTAATRAPQPADLDWLTAATH